MSVWLVQLEGAGGCMNSHHLRVHGPTFKRHVRAHQAVINNEVWYSDAPPSLGKAFSVASTAKRHTVIIKLLLRAADRAARAKDSKLAEAYNDLADKMSSCRPRRRCGSLACVQCARAFQRAKVAAQQRRYRGPQKVRPTKAFGVRVRSFPKAGLIQPGQFADINIPKANRWLKDALKRQSLTDVMVGSADLGWENRRGGNYLQLHWHLVMWTDNPKRLKKKLKTIMPRTKPYERPVDVTKARDHGFLAYMNKVIKLPELLRRNRKHLPELLLVGPH